MDIFSYSVFESEAHFIQLSPECWKKEIENIKIDMLFVESAWRGKDDLWDDKVKNCSNELVELVAYFKSHNVPTVFWNKEDPYHFTDFINSAKLFDFVYTTDIACIPLYKKYLTHSNIYLLPFACQPKIHNPIEKYKRKNTFVFAGAYYERFKKRNRDFFNLVEILKEIEKIDIYDRNYGKDTIFKFPKIYHEYIRGGLGYNEIDKAYKGYRYAINLNSIITSPSMFSRRVFELMASNTIVVSNYSIGIKNFFGELVLLGANTKILKDKMKQLQETPLYYKKYKLAALRKVMSEHTARIRLEEIISKISLHKMEKSSSRVLCIGYAKKESDFKLLEDMFLSQTYSYKYLLIVYYNTIKRKTTRNNNIFYICDDVKEYYINNVNNIGYIAGFNVDDYYGKNYLLDLSLAIQYSDAKIISKTGYYTLAKNRVLSLRKDTNPYTFSDFAKLESSIIKINDIADIELIKCARNINFKTYQEKNILLIDEFNYCKNGLLYSLNLAQKNIVNDLEDLDTGMVLNEKWIRKQLSEIHHGYSLLTIKYKMFKNFLKKLYYAK